LMSADYSQIELRMLAHLCGDKSFVAAFVDGEDIHSRTAREVLTGGAEPDATMRRRAKTINFGILYGLSEFGLSKQLDIPRSEARTYIANYFARYPKIRSFFDQTFVTARERGYVETITGRRRYLPDLNSKNHNARSGAERIAMNTPIQGSAADLIKAAMLKVHARLTYENLKTKLLLQVHDELVFEVPRDEIELVTKLVRDEMVHVMTLAVPLVVDVGYGDNWGTAH
jgi:DNA polymerase I